MTPDRPSLLPCPFCGSAPDIAGINSTRISCSNDQCIAWNRMPAPFNDWSHRVAAIEAWNRRTPASPQGEAVAPDWTDDMLLELIAVGLRHVEYKRGTRGPTIDEIREGVAFALLKAPPAPPEDGWQRMTDEARAMQARHLDKHEGDVYHAMQALVTRFGKRSNAPMVQPIAAPPEDARDADMFWNADDPEMAAESIVEIITHPHEDQTPGTLRRIQRAYRLPDVLVRIVEITPEGCDPDISYEIVAEGHDEIEAALAEREKSE